MDFQQLWKKFKSGQANAEEIQQLAQLLEKTESMEQLKIEIEQHWKALPNDLQTSMSEQEKSLIYQRIRPSAKIIQMKSTSQKTFKKWWSIVAGLALLLIGIGVFWQNQTPHSAKFVQISTQQEIQRHQLPDGSVVWVNRNSELEYTSPFSDSIRKVKMQGEGYFQVISNPHKPFIVEAQGIETRVLGTSFNINAYPDLEAVKIALVEGKVQVKVSEKERIDLRPGEEIFVSKHQQTYAKTQFTKDQPQAWRQGIIYFDGADVEEVAFTLSNWFGVAFDFENKASITSELVYRFDTKSYGLEEVIEHINQVTDYRITKSNASTYLIQAK